MILRVLPDAEAPRTGGGRALDRARIAPAEHLALPIRLGDVIAVVGRRADNLGWGCDRAEKLDLADRKGLSVSGRGENCGPQLFEVGDQRVAFGSERIDGLRG